MINNIRKLIYILIAFTFLSCDVSSVVDIDEPIIVVEKLPFSQYRCKYKHAHRTYYIQVVTHKVLKKGDTLWIK